MGLKRPAEDVETIDVQEDAQAERTCGGLGLQTEHDGAFQAVQAPAVQLPPPKPRPDKEPF